MDHLVRVETISFADALRSTITRYLAERRRDRAWRHGVESTVVGLLNGALVFEQSDDPLEVCLCCAEAIRRLDSGRPGTLVDDPAAKWFELKGVLEVARDKVLQQFV